MPKKILLIVFIFIYSTVIAQKIKVTTGKTSSIQTALEEKLDSIFSSFNKSTPGVAVTVLQNGKVWAKKAYGMASLEHNAPFTHNTVVRINYSEGREFISIATALMEKDGLLNINDRVRKYFPELPAWSEQVTIQHLLNHSSGFIDEWSAFELTQASLANRVDRSQFLQLLYDQPLPEVEPGKGYMYSNSDFGLLRLILEKASGEDLANYLSRKIFNPLGMSSTLLLNDKEQVIANHAFLYNAKTPGKYALWLRAKTSPGANYHILTSANDLEKWAAIHADETSFISKAVKRLEQDARPIPVLEGINYAFGFKRDKSGNYETIMHRGIHGETYITSVPAKNLTIICLSNLRLPNGHNVNAIIRHVLQIKDTAKPEQRIMPATPIHFRKEDLTKYAGTYRWLKQSNFESSMENIKQTELEARGDSLYWLYDSDNSIGLVPVGDGIFKDPDYSTWINFSQPHPDSLMYAELINHFHDSYEITGMKKDPTPKPKYSRDHLTKLTGIYYSKHLDYYWTIVLDKEDRLIVKRPTISEKVLQPGPGEEFTISIEYFEDFGADAWIRFHLNNIGDATHFTIRHPRLMHHRFDKVEVNFIK